MDQKDLVIHQTCTAWPEQYDVYHKGEIVGYIRLRHGILTVEATIGDEDVLLLETIEPEGDGEFLPEERQHFLDKALGLISTYYHTKS